MGRVTEVTDVANVRFGAPTEAPTQGSTGSTPTTQPPTNPTTAPTLSAKPQVERPRSIPPSAHGDHGTDHASPLKERRGLAGGQVPANDQETEEEMNPDDEPLDVRLTRAQWRGVKHAIGEMWAGPQDVLYDRLALMDLDDEHLIWRDLNGSALSRRPERLADLLPGVVADLAQRHIPQQRSTDVHDPDQWIDPALSEAEAYEAWSAMQQASCAEEAEAIYDTYGRG